MGRRGEEGEEKDPAMSLVSLAWVLEQPLVATGKREAIKVHTTCLIMYRWCGQELREGSGM